MGFFDGWRDFKTTADGKVIYYPNSFLGKGFIVPSPQKKQEFQKAVNRLSAIFVALTGIIFAGTWVSARLFVSFGIWRIALFFLILLLTALIGYRHLLTNLTRGLVESNIRLSILEKISNLPFSSSFISLLFSELAYWFFVYYGLKIMDEIKDYAWYVKPFGISVFIFGVLGSIVSGYLIILKAKAYFSK